MDDARVVQSGRPAGREVESHPGVERRRSGMPRFRSSGRRSRDLLESRSVEGDVGCRVIGPLICLSRQPPTASYRSSTKTAGLTLGMARGAGRRGGQRLGGFAVRHVVASGRLHVQEDEVGSTGRDGEDTPGDERATRIGLVASK